MAAPRIFISYSTKDRRRAASLYADLRKAGAAAFQFGESETAGKPAWEQIVRWISECDAFVVLISANALRSTAVVEEIEMAHDCYINSERKHPAKIIPAIIEARVQPPLLIRRMSFLDLVNYKTGLPKLLSQLGLKIVAPAAPSAAPALQTIDFDKLVREYNQENPPSAKQTRFRSNAKKLITNYKELKPADLPKETEEQHVDSLLADLMGKPANRFLDPKSAASANEAFLGAEHAEPSAVTDRLLNVDPSQLVLPLLAPKLRNEGGTLRWTRVLGATAYVVEQPFQLGSKHLGAEEVYRGTETSYTVPAASYEAFGATFRVKATAGVFRKDSPWSNTVRLAATTPLFTLEPRQALRRPGTPSPPSLTILPGPLFCMISWSPVDGATSYVRERSEPEPLTVNALARGYKQIYAGRETRFVDTGYKPKPGEIRLYRVQALGPWGETAWGF